MDVAILVAPCFAGPITALRRIAVVVVSIVAIMVDDSGTDDGAEDDAGEDAEPTPKHAPLGVGGIGEPPSPTPARAARASSSRPRIAGGSSSRAIRRNRPVWGNSRARNRNRVPNRVRNRNKGADSSSEGNTRAVSSMFRVGRFVQQGVENLVGRCVVVGGWAAGGGGGRGCRHAALRGGG